MAKQTQYTRSTWAAEDDPGKMFRVAEVACVPARERALAGCACVRLVLGQIPEDEERPRRAVAAMEAWARDGAEAPLKSALREAEDAHDRLLDVAEDDERDYVDGNVDAYAAEAVVQLVYSAYGRSLTTMVVEAEHCVATAAQDIAARVDVDTSFWSVAVRETDRRFAAVIRQHIPWPILAAAFAARDRA